MIKVSGKGIKRIRDLLELDKLYSQSLRGSKYFFIDDGPDLNIGPGYYFVDHIS